MSLYRNEPKERILSENLPDVAESIEGPTVLVTLMIVKHGSAKLF